MADTPTGAVTEDAAPIPEYPMPRATGCPLAPPPAVGALRGAKPITKVRIWNGTTPWLITRHADQRALLTDPRVSNDDHEPAFPHVNAHRAAIAPHTPKLITNTDAPEHTRLRRSVNAPFLVKRIEAMRPAVRRIVDDLIDEMLAGPNPADLLTVLALPVPSLVIAELLGVPYEDHELFQGNSNRVLDSSLTADEAAVAGRALGAYVGTLFQRKPTGVQPHGDRVRREVPARRLVNHRPVRDRPVRDRPVRDRRLRDRRLREPRSNPCVWNWTNRSASRRGSA